MPSNSHSKYHGNLIKSNRKVNQGYFRLGKCIFISFSICNQKKKEKSHLSESERTILW